MLTITVEIDRPAADAQAVKESLAMELERFGDARVVAVEQKDPEQLTLPMGSNRSEGPRPKPKLTGTRPSDAGAARRGGAAECKSVSASAGMRPTERATTSEALAYIAKRRARLNRWASTRVAEVAHPRYGSVAVPYNSNLDAVECAAEYWGCTVSDINDAQVVMAAPGAIPVSMPM